MEMLLSYILYVIYPQIYLNINTVNPGLSTTHALLYFKPKTIYNVHLYISLAT